MAAQQPLDRLGWPFVDDCDGFVHESDDLVRCTPKEQLFDRAKPPRSDHDEVDSFDGDGETDRLYPHPGDKRFNKDDEFKPNTVCETGTGRERPAYWVTFAPV